SRRPRRICVCFPVFPHCRCDVTIIHLICIICNIKFFLFSSPSAGNHCIFIRFTAVYLYFYAKNNYTFFQMPYCIFIKNVVYYPLSTISENNHKRNRPLLPASSGPGGNLFQEDMNMKEKVVLAYSGGLDTTALIPWLKETFDYDVICCCV